MKDKIIVNIVGLLILFFAFAGTSFAATSVRLQSPAAQTNQNTLSLTFVALDTDSTKTVNVDCWKKGPSDGSFSIFQSFSLPNGGNTDACNAGFNQGNGTYSFYVTAAGSTSPTSSTVSTDFNNSFPGTPTGYRKEKINSCTYKISFRTANNTTGETSSVALYRSSDSNFPLDDAHRVNTLSIGSDTDGSITNDISPNCSTNEYFYAIRAFDAYGRASGATGDSSTITIEASPAPSQAQGAIPATEGESVLGSKTTSDDEKEAAKKEVLGTEDTTTGQTAPDSLKTGPIDWVMGHKKISLTLLAFILAGGYLAFRYRKNRAS